MDCQSWSGCCITSHTWDDLRFTRRGCPRFWKLHLGRVGLSSSHVRSLAMVSVADNGNQWRILISWYPLLKMDLDRSEQHSHLNPETWEWKPYPSIVVFNKAINQHTRRHSWNQKQIFTFSNWHPGFWCEELELSNTGCYGFLSSSCKGSWGWDWLPLGGQDRWWATRAAPQLFSLVSDHLKDAFQSA